MGSYSSEPESPIPVLFRDPNPSPNSFPKKNKNKKIHYPRRQRRGEDSSEEEPNTAPSESSAWPRKGRKAACGGGGVMLEGYLDSADGADPGSDGSGGVGRTKSLTDEDLEELKGCLDLGFGFSYEEIPELCNTLPALELCYSMSQRFLDEQHRSPESGGEGPEPSGNGVSSLPIANWRISSPGDHPEEVKARLKYWAQAVACTVRLCS